MIESSVLALADFYLKFLGFKTLKTEGRTNVKSSDNNIKEAAG